MGAGNAQRVLLSWQHLDGAPIRALLQMSLTILDADEAPRWWGGREPLAGAIGHRYPSETDTSEEADRVRRNANRAVDRALKALRDAGAITTAVRPRGGRRAEYAIHFDGPSHDGERRVSRDAERRPQGDGEHRAMGDGDRGPKEDAKRTEEHQRKKSPQVTNSPASVDNRPSPRATAPVTPGPCINGHRQIGRRIVECEDCQGQGCDASRRDSRHESRTDDTRGLAAHWKPSR